MTHMTLRQLSLLALITLVGSSAQCADWPQFLGPQRNGQSAETGLLKAWPQGGVKEVWRVPGGVGMSAISISQGKAYTLFQDAAQQYLLALDAKTGATLWKTPLAKAYKNQQGDGPRASPTIVDQVAYAYTGEGVLAAVQADSGKLLWSVNAPRQLGGKPADYGMASSPLAVGKCVVVHVGAPRATVAAFAKSDGSLVWQAGSGAAGYASPTLLTFNQVAQVVSFTGTAAYGIQPNSGKVLWQYPYVTEFNCNTASPINVDGQLFLSAGENHGSVMLQVGAGKVSPVWETLGRRSVMRSEWQTAIHLNGYLYGFDNVGSAGPVSHLTCIDAKTGEQQWQEPRFGKGNLISAEGKLILVTTKGELAIAQASPKKYEELGRQTVCDFTRQAPSLAAGLLYLRDDKEIICLDLRAR